MIKSLIIVFNTLSVFLFSFFFGDSPVSITGNFPKNVKPNTEFTAELLIKKGSLGGFAKLQLEVPQGFTVKEIESKGGNFSFENNIAKIIWTATPADPEFVVKFSLVADATTIGLKTISSKFSYVNNNVKEVIEMTPVEITVGEGELPAITAAETTTAPIITPVETKTETPTSSQTEVTKVENPITETVAEQNPSIICKRTFSKGANANEINIDVRIKKGSIKGFAKYQEVLPVGCIAKSGLTNGSSFSVSDGKAKFVWVSLPADEELLISYVLETSNLTPADAKLEKGEFSYLENDQSKKTAMPIELISTGNLTSTKNGSQTEPNNAAVVQPTVDVAVKTETTQLNATTEYQKSNVVSNKEGNVFYCTQIGAFKNAIATDVLTKKFKINETIKTEMTDGFNKFMVGNFSEYKLARSKREEMKNSGCASAFVAAYNGAKRITVQEALMITSQKWFK